MPVNTTIGSTDFWVPVVRETMTSAKWNTHMSIYRGHMLPIDGSLSAAANSAYDLGSSDHKWRNIYADKIVAKPGYSFSTITAALSITTQHIILCDASTAAYTCTLPAANVNTGTSFIFTKTDVGYNQITIDGNGSELINDTTTSKISTYGEMLELVCDGVKWYKKSRYIDKTIRSYTPTGSYTTNVTYLGRIARDGRFADVQVLVAMSGAVTSAALSVDLPSGLTPDTSALAFTTTATPCVGKLEVNDVSTGQIYNGTVFFAQPNTFLTYLDTSNQVYSYVNGIGTTSPMTWASGDSMWCTFRIPITGWEG